MPTSPEPPSARNSTASPGIIGIASIRAAHGDVVQQAQTLDGEIGFNRVEDVGVLVEQSGEAAGSNHGGRAAKFALDPLGQALEQGDIAPVDADDHLALGRAADD